MFDRYNLGISIFLVSFILVLMGIHLSSARGEVSVQVSTSVVAHNEHYQANLSTEPATVNAGDPFTLTLDILDVNGETPVPEFEEVHTKLLHLILVSQDLTEFLHVHPDYKGNGRFVLDNLVLPQSANYIVFADFTPSGDHQQVVRLTLPTQNAEDISAALEVSETESTSAPLKFTLAVPQTLNANRELKIQFHVTDAGTGEPVDTLDEYLGAAGHLVIVDESGEVYLHTHPAGHDMGNMDGMTMSYGPDLEFETQFPATGIYKLWLQVQFDGEVYTAPFVVDVTGTSEATPEVTSHANSGHG
jgi:hypothetical protein